MTSSPTYAEQRAVRAGNQRLDRCTVFGLVWGVALGLYAAAQRWTVLGVDDGLWEILVYVGLSLVGLAVFCPLALMPLERLLRAVTGALGGLALRTALTVIFGLLVVPLGFVVQKFSVDLPVRQWHPGRPTGESYGWQDFSGSASGSMRAIGKGLWSWPLPVRVLLFFSRRGQWLLVPVLVVMLLLGMLLFFAHTSVLAPLIYPLF
ncbi:MAG: DUF5989 family protein [Pseudomonadota bacterium]